MFSANNRIPIAKAGLEVLTRWLGEHVASPYADEAAMTRLCLATGLDRPKVEQWLVNTRREQGKRSVQWWAMAREMGLVPIRSTRKGARMRAVTPEEWAALRGAGAAYTVVSVSDTGACVYSVFVYCVCGGGEGGGGGGRDGGRGGGGGKGPG